MGTTETRDVQEDSDHHIRRLLLGAGHIPLLINGSLWPVQEEEKCPNRESSSGVEGNPDSTEWLEDAVTNM